MPIDVLLVEDNPSDAVLIKNALSEFPPGVRITVAKAPKPPLLFCPILDSPHTSSSRTCTCRWAG